MRLFFALWPPAATAAALHAWALAAQKATGGRATRADTIHLTLAFLGETDPARVGAAVAAGRAAQGARHVLPIEQARYWKHNRLVWAGPRVTDPALADALAAHLRAAGFVLEARAFKAHVTLVRKASPAQLPALPAVDWPVDEFVLVRSALSAGAPAYEVLARFPLRNPGSE